jgi:hypothetical protein
VNAAANSSATSMDSEITSLNHFGPSWTSGFGSTVTSVFTAP